MTKQQFSHAVRGGRTLTGMSLKDCAEVMNTSSSTLSRWELGQSVPIDRVQRSVVAVLCARIRRIMEYIEQDRARAGYTRSPYA